MTVHSFEEHGPCVLAHGSMRTFRDGGFADVQPSWVYFFRDGVLVRGAGFPTREAALEAIKRYRAEELCIDLGQATGQAWTGSLECMRSR